MSEQGAFGRLLAQYHGGTLLRLELTHMLMEAVAYEPLDTLEEQLGRKEFLGLKGLVALYPWTDEEWEKLKLIRFEGVTRAWRGTAYEVREQFLREQDEWLRSAKITVRLAVERFREHFGIEGPITDDTTLVVAMWRPDEDRPYFLDGHWAADAQVYYLHKIPRETYAGQDRWPMPFFPMVSEAEEYLGLSRPHTACQVGFEDFRRRWPSEKPVMPKESEHGP